MLPSEGRTIEGAARQVGRCGRQDGWWGRKRRRWHRERHGGMVGVRRRRAKVVRRVRVIHCVGGGRDVDVGLLGGQ